MSTIVQLKKKKYCVFRNTLFALKHTHTHTQSTDIDPVCDNQRGKELRNIDVNRKVFFSEGYVTKSGYPLKRGGNGQ